MIRFCRWDSGRCYRSLCTSLSPSGEVVVCRRHGNPFGLNLPRMSKPDTMRVRVRR